MSWQIDEIRFLQQNTLYYYKRGGADNSYDFNDEYIQFNKDKSGVRYDKGVSYPLKWDFIDQGKTKIKIIMQESPQLIVIWENLIYNETSLKYSEYYTRRGTNSLAVVTRTPIASIPK